MHHHRCNIKLMHLNLFSTTNLTVSPFKLIVFHNNYHTFNCRQLYIFYQSFTLEIFKELISKNKFENIYK